jgi:hypothetical protein
MPSTPAVEAGSSARFYRFRSVDALLGKRSELAEQYIYFAEPSSLNDPLEGFKDIVWNGDAIAWRNHLRHYLLCLIQTVSILYIMGPSYDAVRKHDFALTTPARLPTDQYRTLFDGICSRFFANSRVAAYPTLLESRGAMRRDEWLFYLWTLHPHAVRTVMQAFADNSLCPPDGRALFKDWGAEPLDAAYFDMLHEALASTPGEDSASEFYASARVILDQNQMLAGAEPDPKTVGWAVLLGDFPSTYLDRLQALMHPDWYTACFVADYRQPAMWGHYGDSHAGVCLEFNSIQDGAGRPALPLRQQVGVRISGDEIKPIMDVVRQQFHPVRYENGPDREVDFFSSLGRLSAPDLAFWFQAADGARSSAAGDLFEAEDAWHQAYWARHFEILTTKRAGWAHEQEHRLVLTSGLTDFREIEARKLTFDLESLSGIIFGLKTPTTDKREIVRILREKCEAAGRTDFDFYQAYHSRASGQIERVKLSLL